MTNVNTLVTYSRGKNKFDNCPDQRSCNSFNDFERAVTSDLSPEKGLAFVCSPLQSGPHYEKPEKYPGEATWRLRNYALPRQFLAFDFDGFSDPEVFPLLFEDLQQYRGFGYTTASYTDDDGTAESATSSATSAVTDIDKAFMFTSEIIKASAAPDGGYALDPNEDIIKLTLNVDMARISDSSVESILGGVLDFSIDWSKVEAIEYNDDSTEAYLSAEAAITDLDSATTFAKFFELNHSASTADQFDTITITSLHISGNPPFITLVDDTDTTDRNFVDHDSENDLAYIYLNPIDSITSLDITFGGLVNINQGDDADVTQLSYTTTIDIL